MKWWLSGSSPYRAGMLWKTNAFRPSRLVNPHFPLSAEHFSSQTTPILCFGVFSVMLLIYTNTPWL